MKNASSSDTLYFELIELEVLYRPSGSSPIPRWLPLPTNGSSLSSLWRITAIAQDTDMRFLSNKVMDNDTDFGHADSGGAALFISSYFAISY